MIGQLGLVVGPNNGEGNGYEHNDNPNHRDYDDDGSVELGRRTFNCQDQGKGNNATLKRQATCHTVAQRQDIMPTKMVCPSIRHVGGHVSRPIIHLAIADNEQYNSIPPFIIVENRSSIFCTASL